MEMFKHILFEFVCIVALTTQLVHGQSQSGFISIDCGISENSGYTDKLTGLNYTSDATFIETGVSKNILPEYTNITLEQQFLNVRSFPEGVKNCYTLKVKPLHGNLKFLIRARFMYGNYDGLGQVPSFDLLLEADVWDSVELKDASTIVTKEIIHIPKKNYVYVCLVNTGSGTPFISALELRPVSNSTYQTESGSLLLSWRWDVGSNNNGTSRYRDDPFDRIWTPYNSNSWVVISSSQPIDSSGTDYKPPSAVMKTAVVPANISNSLQFSWDRSNNISGFYVYFYFAEVQGNRLNQTREQAIYLNGNLWNNPSVIYVYNLFATTFRSTRAMEAETIDFSINKTENSSLPPILNAFEAYAVKEFSQFPTNQQDVDAVMNINSMYELRSIWQGDPCGPKNYMWQGINCSYDDYNPPRIISLNLSSKGIFGEISPYISSLISIESLDLSNNNLTGSVPEFLSQLPFLTVLNLSGNKLKGSIPAALMDRKQSGLLSLSVEGNPDLCLEASCKGRDKNKLTVPVAVVPIVAVTVLICVILTAMIILWNFKTRKRVAKQNNKSFESKTPRYKYSDLVGFTNNFERAIGKGGFGAVYHGYLDDTQVAVKMLSSSSVQGFKEFKAEIELLMRVHHKNLTTLVGYCDEPTNMGLIYEFMANGNLQSHLLENDADTLSWEGRLRIATEAAQGLEYLHSGCKPPIVHRDVKTTNILLDKRFQAKLSDFGLSRIFSVESGTHVSTVVAGTPGYLDPEYYISNRLTEKSDVYNFGVVLLEIITDKPVIDTLDPERTHVSQWVSFMLAKGDIANIVDPRLNGDFETNSVWKAVEIAMTCVSPTSAKRPTMNRVVMELHEALEMEVAHKKMGKDAESKDSMLSMNLNLDTEMSPILR
ncbi:putative leucine-rich repeat receptor-like protein kinase At2g19210 [Mangifera indica]|uniref:putative leucine-rich repeat receptor-like protein kinase At2g19210 n=1 Tax=Mangifera indica TaxID=29780 RepID=UPI001CFB440E|nr:putative leucine-rich repeat receptor-like protein kinase At2g19210 [Mangifera indica]